MFTSFQIRNPKHRNQFSVAPGMEINLPLTVTHLNNHPLLPPSSLYLAIHASIGRVIRMSGRGEKYESTGRNSTTLMALPPTAQLPTS
jgi:hypothetical protein